MTFLQAAILGILQGITEFLPISSSGHLVLFQDLLGLNDAVALKGFDIAVHFGTLLAIFIYFRKDFRELIRAFYLTLTRHKPVTVEAATWLKTQQKMLIILVIGTIPAILVGLLLGDIIDEHLLTPYSVAIMLALVAVFFLVAERIYKKLKHKTSFSIKEGLLIGVAQSLALIPGVSRSGATITTGLLLGVERDQAARFSFLLGSVAMVAATAYALFKVAKGDYSLPPLDILLTGIFSSFVAGWLAVRFLMGYLKKHTLAAFAYYRFLLVAALVVWFYFI